MTVHVVVAKHREDVSWIPAEPSWNVRVYDKGPDGNVPNVGREAETFARFVAEEYDALKPGDTVYFLQGNPFDHCPDILERLGKTVDVVTPLGIMHSCDADGYPEHPGLPVGRAHATILGTPPTMTWDFAAGAQYAVPGRCLLERPRKDWERICALLRTETICAWAMERLWPALFAAVEPPGKRAEDHVDG